MSTAISKRKSKKLFRNKADVNAAARAAGIPVLDLEKYKGAAMVGQIIEECNVLHVGLSMYAFSKPKLEAVMAKCDWLLETLEDPESVALIGNLQRTLALAYQDLATSIIESVSANTGKTKNQQRSSFPPNALVQAVIITEKEEPKQVHDV